MQTARSTVSICPIDMAIPNHMGFSIYLSNESSQTSNLVLFDEMNVTLTRPILQVNDYYPFGMAMVENGYENVLEQENRFLYNGKELQSDLELNLYDYDARYYDPSIGRTTTIDPHSQRYMSNSPYSFFANNPLLFVDPDGKDIVFHMWKNMGDNNWERVKVNYNDLDKNLQVALEAFAKSEEGFTFLSQFAKEGDKIGEVEFKKDGEFSKHEMSMDQFHYTGSAFGTSGFGNTKDKAKFYMKFNTSRSQSFRNPESYAITAGHEAFIHLDQYASDLIDAIENNDVDAFFKIKEERDRIAEDRYGGVEHDAYIEGKPEFTRMKGYIQQLKAILNPKEVNKQIQLHDQKLNNEKR